MGASPAVTACSLTNNLHVWRGPALSEVERGRRPRQTRPVVKTTVTSPVQREMQVRILPRGLRPCSLIGKAPCVPLSLVPRP